MDTENRFERIEQKLDKILDILEKEKESNTNFLETICHNIKIPFYYTMNKITSLIASEKMLQYYQID